MMAMIPVDMDIVDVFDIFDVVEGVVIDSVTVALGQVHVCAEFWKAKRKSTKVRGHTAILPNNKK